MISLEGRAKTIFAQARNGTHDNLSIGVNLGSVRTHDSTASGAESDRCTSGYLRSLEKDYLNSNHNVKKEQRNRHDHKSRPYRAKA